MMKIEVIMRETIRPSSSTPPHKCSFKLSVIDKVTPAIFVKFMSFYSPAQTKNIQNLDHTLKDSLSRALTIFYPFAGRANDDFTIDCNDDGVIFVIAFVDCELVDLLQNPKPRIDSFHQFLPLLPPFCPNGSCKPSLLAFQLNKFSCGGIAISFCFNHLLIDAITMATFLKCWSEIAANVDSATNYTICPAVSMYPQGSTDEVPPKNLSRVAGKLAVTNGPSRGSTKRFNFTSLALTKMKENSVSEHVPFPTRVEALTSFIWKHLMLASEVVRGYKQPSVLTQAVDLRRRMPLKIMPTVLPVGNLVWPTVAHYRRTAKTESDDKMVEKELVYSLRQSVINIKENFIPKLFSKGGYDTICNSLDELEETISDATLTFPTISSWHKIGLADTNFGWGKPIWVSLTSEVVDSLLSNIVVLIDSGNESIDAWIAISEKEMKVLENNLDFLAFALPNPSIFVNSI